MKSTIQMLADYKQFPIQREVTISCPEEFITKEFRHVVRPFKKVVPVEVAEPGDVAMLKLESSLPKFNKPMVPVTIGGGLFCKELEDQVAGHKVSETFAASVDGETVTVTVLKATRTQFPSPTDEMVAAYSEAHTDYAGIKTLAQYREKVVADYLEKARTDAIYSQMQDIMNYVLTHSDWNFDEAEVAELEEAMLADERSYVREELGIELEDMTGEQLAVNFGTPDWEAFRKALHNEAERQVATILWDAVSNGIDPVEATPETAQWNFDFLEKYVRENVKIVEVSK